MKLKLRASMNGKVVYEKSMESFPIVIGRVAPADVVIQDMKVSSKHAQVSWDGQSFFIEDLDSSNGTYLGGQRLQQKQQLALPCTLMLGKNVQLKISEEAEVVAAAVLPAAIEAPMRATPVMPPKPAPARVAPQARVRGGVLTNLWKLMDADLIWEPMTSFSARQFVLAVLALSGAGIFFGMIFSDYKPWMLLFMVPLGMTFMILISWGFAAVLALPGLLTRRSYDVRPLLYGFTVAAALFFVNEVLASLCAHPIWSIFTGKILPFTTLASILAFWAPFNLTVFPHAWFKYVRWVMFPLSCITAVIMVMSYYSKDHQASYQKLFAQNDTALSRMVAGKQVEVSVLISEMRDEESH